MASDTLLGGLVLLVGVVSFLISCAWVYFCNRKKLNPEQLLELDMLRYSGEWRHGSRESDYAIFDEITLASDLDILRNAAVPTSEKSEMILRKFRELVAAGMLESEDKHHNFMPCARITAAGYDRMEQLSENYGHRGGLGAVRRFVSSIARGVALPVIVSITTVLAMRFVGLD
ncbi:MAG: hypothetical protein ACK41Y_06645 [Paracoccus hibiscisoli]|uniref:hypothetical protein n=1 Tax=Paracoccus hibiscisoli TaxID=2023261 RepID=UPI00391A03B8